MRITGFRYAWEPSVYHSAAGDASGGGGNPPGDGKQGSEGGGDPPGDGKEGGDGKGEGDPPKPDGRFSQADVDRIVAQRLEAEKDREKKRTEKATREATERAARESGEWQTVAETRQARIDELQAEIDRMNADMDNARLETIRERVGAKHHIPAQLVPRLQGTDEASIEADAKALVKVLGTREAPNPETGRGAGANGGGMTAAQQQAATRTQLREKINYTPI